MMGNEQFDFDRLVIKAHKIALRCGAEIAVDDAITHHGLMMHALEVAPRYEHLFPGVTTEAEYAVQRAESRLARACAFFGAVADG